MKAWVHPEFERTCNDCEETRPSSWFNSQSPTCIQCRRFERRQELYGWQDIQPQDRNRRNPLDVARIAAWSAIGIPYEEIAKYLGGIPCVNVGVAINHMREDGIPLPRRHQPGTAERVRVIENLLNQGLSWSQAAESLGLTKNVIAGVVRRYLPHRHKRKTSRLNGGRQNG